MAEKPDEDVFYDVISDVIDLDSIQHRMVDDEPNDEPGPEPMNDQPQPDEPQQPNQPQPQKFKMAEKPDVVSNVNVIDLDYRIDDERNNQSRSELNDEPQPKPLKSKPLNDEDEPQPDETLNDQPRLPEPMNDRPDAEPQLVSRSQRETKPRPQKLAIFVIGQTGAGKSTLINSLLKLRGEKEAFVAHDMYPGNHDMLEEHKGLFCGVPTTLYDSRGLGDPQFNSAVFLKKFDNAIKEHGDRYLVFICQDFNSRWDDSVVKFGRLMARKFRRNYEIWKKSILILTKANNYTYPDAAEGDVAKGDVAKGDVAKGDVAKGDVAKGDAAKGDAAKGDVAKGDVAKGDVAKGDAAKGDVAKGKEIAEDKKKLKMMIKTREWCVKFKSCLTKYGVPEEIIARMLVCPTGSEKSEVALFKDWKEELMELCIEAENDWDIYRQIKSPRKNVSEIAGGVLPVFGPPIGMAIETILAEKSKKKEIRKCEEEKAQVEALDFDKKGKFFESVFKGLFNR